MHVSNDEGLVHNVQLVASRRERNPQNDMTCSMCTLPVFCSSHDRPNKGQLNFRPTSAECEYATNEFVGVDIAPQGINSNSTSLDGQHLPFGDRKREDLL